MVPQRYFSQATITSLEKIPKGSKIHVVGVCGVAMAQMAILLSEIGYEVSGSDKEFYEPMGSVLAKSKVRLCQGYSAENVPKDAALVLIGNAVSYGHPEIMEVEKRRLPYSIFPSLLYDLVVNRTHGITVAGTHGKTTTSALMASVLKKCGKEPGYFVGGISLDLPQSLARGRGEFSVVEGDEYDSAFFAKVPKFAFYAPKTLILTAIEYDHADIYPDLESIKVEFDKLVQGLPKDGTLIACLDQPNIASSLPRWRPLGIKIFTYGTIPGADFQIVEFLQHESSQRARVIKHAPAKWGQSSASPLYDTSGEFSFTLPLPGIYNALNALAVIIGSIESAGLTLDSACKALLSFSGVKRRQEVRYRGGITLVEDFAHHPTAVRETIGGIKKWFPNRRVVAVFEPRSNTSRKRVFQQEYVTAFSQADLVILCEVATRSIDACQELLNVGELGENISQSGVRTITLSSPEQIYSFLEQEMLPGDVVLVMSNGSFGGLPAKLEIMLKRRGA